VSVACVSCDTVAAVVCVWRATSGPHRGHKRERGEHSSRMHRALTHNPKTKAHDLLSRKEESPVLTLYLYYPLTLLAPSKLGLLAPPPQAGLIHLPHCSRALLRHAPRRRHGPRQVCRADLLDCGALLPVEVLVPAATEGRVESDALEAVVEPDGPLVRLGVRAGVGSGLASGLGSGLGPGLGFGFGFGFGFGLGLGLALCALASSGSERFVSRSHSSTKAARSAAGPPLARAGGAGGGAASDAASAPRARLLTRLRPTVVQVVFARSL